MFGFYEQLTEVFWSKRQTAFKQFRIFPLVAFFWSCHFLHFARDKLPILTIHFSWMGKQHWSSLDLFTWLPSNAVVATGHQNCILSFWSERKNFDRRGKKIWSGGKNWNSVWISFTFSYADQLKPCLLCIASLWCPLLTVSAFTH